MSKIEVRACRVLCEKVRKELGQGLGEGGCSQDGDKAARKVLELKKRLKKREKSGVNELFNIIWTGLNKLRLKRGVGC